jgi:LemA protein
MIGLAVLVLLVVLLLCYGVALYNGLVRARNEVKLSWSNIDVLLAQRHDELPKLIEVCKRYMQHESATLERVAQARSAVDSARSAGDLSSLSRAEGTLRSGLSGLYAVAERYPNLKADALFQALQARVSGLETAIADRREVYNEAANAQNVRIETFPDSLVAGFFDFPVVRLLKFNADEKADVDVKAAFSS